MRVLMLIACGSLLMQGGCAGPGFRFSGAAAPPAFELSADEERLIQALAHYSRGLLHEGEAGATSAEALAHYEAAWRIAPDHALSLKIATLAMNRDEAARAVAVLTQSAAEAPADAARRADLAAATYAAGDTAAALAHYRKALVLAPEATPLYLACAGILLDEQRDREAFDTLRQAQRHADRPDLVPAYTYQQANRFIREGSLPRAIACMELLLEWNSGRSALLHHVLAELHALEGQHAISRLHLQHAIEQPDTLPESYLDLAASYAAESPERQTDILQAGTRRFDRHLRLHHALAYSLAGQERYEPAIPAFAVVLEGARFNPTLEAAYLDEAFYLHYGATLERSDRYEEAATRFREGLARFPRSHHIMNYLAYMWAEQNVHLEDAMDIVEQALELAPDNGAYVDTRGWILYRQGRYEAALEDIRRAHRLLGDDPEILEHLGDVHAALEQPEKALRYWRQSLELDPDRPAVAAKLEATAGGDTP